MDIEYNIIKQRSFLEVQLYAIFSTCDIYQDISYCFKLLSYCNLIITMITMIISCFGLLCYQNLIVCVFFLTSISWKFGSSYKGKRVSITFLIQTLWIHVVSNIIFATHDGGHKSFGKTEANWPTSGLLYCQRSISYQHLQLISWCHVSS